MRRLGLLLPMLMGSCSTTTFDLAHSDSAERWIRERASSSGQVDYETGPGAVSRQHVASLESLTDDRTISIEQIRQVVVVKRARGALEGALIGATAGILFGVTAGVTQDLSAYERSMDCTIVCSKADAAKWQGAIAGGMGVLLGAAVGALIGHRDILVLR